MKDQVQKYIEQIGDITILELNPPLENGHRYVTHFEDCSNFAGTFKTLSAARKSATPKKKPDLASYKFDTSSYVKIPSTKKRHKL